MKVKIIKANDNDCWYSEHIGEEFDVEERDEEYIIIDYKDTIGTVYIIDKDDCEVIEEENKSSFIEKIYIHRQKEDNWDIVNKAIELGFNKTIANDLVYLGYEVEFEVEIFNDGKNRVLSIDGEDVSDLDMSI